MKFNLVVVFLLCYCTIGLQQPTFFNANNFKGLHGVIPRTRFLAEGEIRAVYCHDQTVAVVDLGADNELHGCNIIEVYETSEALEVIKNLSLTTRPQQVTFQEMTTLMGQCDQLEKLQDAAAVNLPEDTTSSMNRMMSNPFTLLSGILPGTKWCGTGDIAENYHDLGQHAQIDRCCRNHDLCPVKVRAHRTRYNLTNYSLYTKSHCHCDETFYKCLKSSSNPTANVMGQIYFNILKVPCIEDNPESQQKSLGSAKRFISVKVEY